MRREFTFLFPFPGRRQRLRHADLLGLETLRIGMKHRDPDDDRSFGKVLVQERKHRSSNFDQPKSNASFATFGRDRGRARFVQTPRHVNKTISRCLSILVFVSGVRGWSAHGSWTVLESNIRWGECSFAPARNHTCPRQSQLPAVHMKLESPAHRISTPRC